MYVAGRVRKGADKWFKRQGLLGPAHDVDHLAPVAMTCIVWAEGQRGHLRGKGKRNIGRQALSWPLGLDGCCRCDVVL